MTRLHPFASTLLLLAAACGGSVSTTGTGGSTGTGTTTTGTCPAAEPTSGAPCSDPGLSCSYGDCCPASATCDGATWSVSLPPCVAPTCPETAPLDGQPCDVCSTEPNCSWSCDNIGDFSAAACVGGAWQFQQHCEQGPVVCGDTTCSGGQICLVKSGGAVTPPSCVDNPCPPGTLDCTCAASLCGGPAFQCSVAGSTLSCVCPTCP